MPATAAVKLVTSRPPGYGPEMLDHPADWRRAREMVAGSPEGLTDAALLARGFESTVIAGLVESGLATSLTEHIWAGGYRVEVSWLRLTDAGRKALGC
jgi:hypothetical protein